MDIISDRGAIIAKDYGVYWFAPGGGKEYKIKQAVPSKFLIDKNGIILWKYIGKDKTDRPSIAMMTALSFISALTANTRASLKQIAFCQNHAWNT